jgi:MYXO-CTERM domain-containing protein
MKRLLTLGLLATLTNSAFGYYFSAYDTTKSAFRDVSNLRITSSDFRIQLNREASESDLYVNNVTYAYDSGWDFGINLSEEGLNGYTLGTPLTGDLNTVYRLASRYGEVNESVALGMYSFSVNIFGGADASANDLIGQYNYSLLVADRFNLQITSAFDKPMVAPGETSFLSLSATNTTSDQTYFTSSFWLGLESDGAAANVPYSFAYVSNFYSGSFAPGQSLSGAHSNYTPTNANAGNSYPSYAGLIGGIYSGDYHWINAGDKPALTVVPEPATLTVLGLGLLAGLRRRRS